MLRNQSAPLCPVKGQGVPKLVQPWRRGRSLKSGCGVALTRKWKLSQCTKPGSSEHNSKDKLSTSFLYTPFSLRLSWALDSAIKKNGLTCEKVRGSYTTFVSWWSFITFSDNGAWVQVIQSWVKISMGGRLNCMSSQGKEFSHEDKNTA